MRLLVSPVQSCNPKRGAGLCRSHFFTIGSWYEERPGPSFLIVDPSAGLWRKPPATLGRPSRVHRLGSGVTVYVYPHDLAGYIHS
jgi:hypothetical protein